jgi:hypothetical protein
MRSVAAGAAVAAIVVACAAGGAAASEAPTGWDGTNPFACELQQAGYGTEVPHPDADPYCVEFDKRRQNVTELGVVDFVTKEPARVSAASPKCFYFQSDHWRGSVVQADGSTKTYEWDGHYFFDKAKGEGGAWVTNFNVNGQTSDPSQIPGMPAEYGRYFGPGTGGVITRNDVKADPSCIAKAEKQSPYAKPKPEDRGPGCVASTSSLPVALGESGARVREALGEPVRVHRGFLRYCVRGGGKLLVGQPGDRSGGSSAIDDAAPVVMVLTTRTGIAVHGVGRGTRARALRAAAPHRRALFTQGATRVYALAGGELAGLRDGRVRFVAVYDRTAIPSARALRAWLRRSQ